MDRWIEHPEEWEERNTKQEDMLRNANMRCRDMGWRASVCREIVRLRATKADLLEAIEALLVETLLDSPHLATCCANAKAAIAKATK